MAASSAQRTHRPCIMPPFALLLIVSFLNAGVMAQPDKPIKPETAAAVGSSIVRGDMVPNPSEVPGNHGSQGKIWDFSTEVQGTQKATAAATTQEPGRNEYSKTEATQKPFGATEFTVVVHTEILKSDTPAPSRGDGPNNKPKPVPKDDVICVTKKIIEDRSAVSLKLKASSNCEESKVKIQSVLQELCSEDCKLEIYQENNSDEILVSGKYVEDDVTGMVNKFNNDNIKDKTDVKEAVPRWGKNSKLVLVSLLLTGLLLAALLVAGYYLKTHRKNSKGVRLAESFQVDEENQANTLVSVAPLPQEPVDKPTVNGESPPENGTNATLTTNGHSATQTPVADTEM
ncbi:hematopoietic progenitor cell antigen CD34 [Oreochromis aureus]|uniref:Uncharacterized protein n=1 Tax=Oreochromis aureus TaxID=47969 RepID=A0AAZ1XV72_OREAU|nr:hematopoietic progenitor cell antigen CD34 [Oreochromis aureus]